MLIAEGASDAVVRQVQNAIVNGMVKTGFSAFTVTAVVSGAENFVFPFAEEIFEEGVKSWIPK